MIRSPFDYRQSSSSRFRDLDIDYSIFDYDRIGSQPRPGLVETSPSGEIILPAMCRTSDDIACNRAPSDRSLHMFAVGFQTVESVSDAEDGDPASEYPDESCPPLADVFLGTDFHFHGDNITFAAVLDTNDSLIGRLGYTSAHSACGDYASNVLSDNRFSWRRDLKISMLNSRGQNPLRECGFHPSSERRMSLTLNQLNPSNFAGMGEKTLDNN